MIFPFIPQVTDTFSLVVADVKLFEKKKIYFLSLSLSLSLLLKEHVQPAQKRTAATGCLFPSFHAHQRHLKLLTQGISHSKDHLHFSSDADATG